MPMTQEDIRQHYEKTWKASDEKAGDDAGLAYSSRIEDAVLYPIYQQLLADLKITVDGGAVLDVGSGSGRWVRYFTQRFRPALLMGIDFTQAATDLLTRRYANLTAMRTEFRRADLTQPGLDLGQRFDLINVMNVLFHIPEPDRFTSALANLAAHLAPAGRIVTTEYMPRIPMRTEWMLVRSRYEFEAAVRSAGLRIVGVRATTFWANDPCGIDDPLLRIQFNQLRYNINQVLAAPMADSNREFFIKLFSEMDSTILKFCQDRLADVELPSQKLVVLAKN